MRALDMRSVIIVPMVARGRRLGAVSLVATARRARFAGDDVELAQELARRAATAVDNARLHSQLRDVATALQESLLPPALPAIEGVDVAARFRPAGEGAEVGGDFYDLFQAPGSAWTVAVGDVCGKGAEAAALTGLARHTLQVAATSGRAPSQVLAMLNAALLRQAGDEQFCTVALMRMEADGDSHRVVSCSAGHPLPLVLRDDGTVEAIGPAGTLLGVIRQPELQDTAVELGAGDAVVLYTDGVTDAQAPGRILMPEDVARMLEECAGMDAAEIARHLEDEATGGDGQLRDDVAILVLKVRGED